MVFIGIDGGGTHSRLLAVDEQGKQLAYLEGSTTNIASNPHEVVQNNLKTLFEQFLQQTGLTLANISALCIGSAGVDVAENITDMTQILRAVGLSCPLRVINDAELILWAEMKDDVGAVLIAGTGSICYGKNVAGQVARVGGWGHLIDDVGSGYWVGKQCATHVMRAFDGRDQRGILSDLLCAHLNIKNEEQLIPLIYSADFQKPDMAAFSQLVEFAAKSGDEKSLAIMHRAAEYGLEMVQTIFSGLQLAHVSSKIILSGGMVVNSEIVRPYITTLLQNAYPLSAIRIAGQTPVKGAVYLARQL